MNVSRQELRSFGSEIPDDHEREAFHDMLSREGGCCSEPDCWQPAYVGSVCVGHSRDPEIVDGDLFKENTE